MDILSTAKSAIDTEIDALNKTKEQLDDNFVNITNVINNCIGKVILTGMGKSGHIAGKIASTMSSIGVSAFYIHPGEALHGDLGIIQKNDVVLALSFSGETDEILNIIPAVQKIGAVILSIVGKCGSTLEKYSQYTFCLPEIKEIFLDNMVPTSSTTAMLAVGDALAVTVATMRNFTKNDFAIFHPHGTLGKKLTLKVGNLMKSGEENAVVLSGSTLQEAILEMCRKPIGCVNVVDFENHLIGIFTDGDLRRYINNNGQDFNMRIDEIMTISPVIVMPELLVVDAVEKMKRENGFLSMLPVVEDGYLKGTLHISDIIKVGLI